MPVQVIKYTSSSGKSYDTFQEAVFEDQKGIIAKYFRKDGSPNWSYSDLVAVFSDTEKRNAIIKEFDALEALN